MSYDQGYWHTEYCIETGINEENAGTHIAVFVKWCIINNLLSDDLAKEDAEHIAKVKAGEMTANEYFSGFFDWKFGEWNLNEEGNDFTLSYYNEYLKDLVVNFPATTYGPEEDTDFEQLSQMLNNRLSEFREKGPRNVSWKKKPWWKIWQP